MESKLPKPSGLKKPIPIQKSILPTDRIKPSGVAGQANKTFGNASGITISAVLQPSNGILQRKERAVSPDLRSIMIKDIPARAKMRRSRSACDIRDMRPSRKRPEPTLSTISAKISRFGNSNNSTMTINSGPTTSRQTKVNSFSGTNTKRPMLPTGRPVLTRTVTVNPAATVANKDTKPKTTGGPTTKRIAPYDFKARFHDLLEKHKILKAKHEKQCEDAMELESLPMQLEESQSRLIQIESELKNEKIDKECLQRQLDSKCAKIDAITCQLGIIKSELSELQNIHTRVAKEHSELSCEVVTLRQKNIDLTKQNKELTEELALCKEQLFQSNMDRKELHNTVMDLRGNIRVFCRVRPSLESEVSRQLCGWNYLDEATVEIQSLDGQSKNKIDRFSFDQVFHPNSDQSEIFEMVSPLIQSALDGYNICIFAYGQTGSGKTYTMDGVPENVGVIPRTVDLLFDSIHNYKRLGWEYEINVSFLEIYNEVLYDLLSNEQKEMEIRMAKNNKNDIYVSNITVETVTTAERLCQLMQIAKSNRATASTVGNERSSRSHAVTKLQLIGKHVEKQEISIGTINLVDLAGSESPKTSTRMTETKNINRSLSELTNVILALLQKQDHIPYRNSKLTHLLMPSLGGNSKTLMFINVSPFQDCFQESVKSLRFAASVNSCKIAKAKRNRYLNTSTVSSSSFDK